MAKRIEITVGADGNYSIDAMDGFGGQSCEQKTANIISILGGVETDKKYKPEYFDPDNLDELTINNGR